MTLYVSNLGFQVSEEDLKNLFNPFGEIASAKIISDRITGRSRGFGFVEMKSEPDAQRAIEALNNKQVDGRSISVAVAREKESQPRSKW